MYAIQTKGVCLRYEVKTNSNWAVTRQNKRHMRRVAKAIMLSALVFTLVGVPVMAMAGVPVVQTVENLLPGSITQQLGQSGLFIGYYLWNHHFPSESDYLNFLLSFGIGYAASAAIAAALYAAGWLSLAVVTGILSATGVGIALAGSIVGF